MASSPIDPDSTLDASVRKIAGLYDTAHAALGESDLPRVQSLLDQIDDLAPSPSDQSDFEPTELNPALSELLTASHSRLLTALAAERSKAEEAIRQSNTGRKALRGYGHRGATTGTRHESIT